MNKKLDKILRRFHIIYALVIVVLFFVSLFFIAYNNYKNKVAIAETISHIVEEKIKNNQLRDVMKVLSSARIDEFHAISYYKSDGTRSVTFPPHINPSYFRSRSVLDTIRYATFSIDLFFDSKRNIKLGTLRFSIDPYESVLTAALFWGFFVLLLLPIAISYRKLIIRNFEQESMALKMKAVREVQRQIRHDSRGAIQAINAVIDSSQNLDELELSTLKSATSRLEGMMTESREKNMGLVEHKIETQKMALSHVYTVVSDILSEKSTLFAAHHIKSKFEYNNKVLATFLKIDELDLKRILSNILDNSLDAISEKKTKKGEIKVNLHAEGGNLVLKISDNGVGIKSEHLPNIGARGYTLKSKGSGLGISWAKEKVQKWGGQLKVDSVYGEGTTLTICLPISEPQEWATESISLSGISNIVAIDDDPSVINQWKQKLLSGTQNSLGFFGYESGERFLREPKLHNDTLYLIDYDLGKYSLNGINVASKIKNKSSVYMVTNNFDDWEIQRFCNDFGVKLIPKTVIPKIEIDK